MELSIQVRLIPVVDTAIATRLDGATGAPPVGVGVAVAVAVAVAVGLAVGVGVGVIVAPGVGVGVGVDCEGVFALAVFDQADPPAALVA